METQSTLNTSYTSNFSDADSGTISSVRVRIAPSPTGDPHVGTAYIGLINMVFAKQHNGKFIIRIEDTDQTRSAKHYEEEIFKSLSWFGLEWDEGPDKGGPYAPYRQSERTSIYQEHSKKLLENGSAYKCFCTPERLEKLREAQKAEKTQIGYDRHCRNLTQDEVDKLLSENTPYVIRIKIPQEGETIIHDRLRGDVVFANSGIDDQVLIKSDGFPTYHLANVVDDHLMKISHVMRAEEWLTSTPKHVLLYKAFGWNAPEFIHLPLLRNKDRSKISKRKNPVSLNYYKQFGYLPEALRNFLALMGWTPPSLAEKFSTKEMIETFSIDKVNLGGPVFDLEKLRWLNGLYIRELTRESLSQKLYSFLFDKSYFNEIVPLVHERMESFADFWKYADFFYTDELIYQVSQLIPKGRSADETITMLSNLLEKIELASRKGWDHNTLEQSFREYSTISNWKTKELFMTTRIVITGKIATPPLFETMSLLGKERVRKRINNAIFLLKTSLNEKTKTD